MGRFLKNLFGHPGTWFLFLLGSVGIGILAPFAAPAMAIIAAIATGVGTILLIPYLKDYFFGSYFYTKRKMFTDWIKDHWVQALIVGLGVGLFITALVLTIGFFTGGGAFVAVGGAFMATGGGAFAFMAPIFQAIATPFAMAAAAAGIELSLPALVGFIAVLTPLCFANNLRRFDAWVDSFKYDYRAEKRFKADGEPNFKYTYAQNWVDSDERKNPVKIIAAKKADDKENLVAKGSERASYLTEVLGGMKATFNNHCSSIDATVREKPAADKELPNYVPSSRV